VSASNIRAGKAFVELSIRDKLTQGLRSASAKLQAFGTGVRTIGTAMAGMGASTLAPLLGAAKIFADTGSAIHDMSLRTGVSADKLSELKFAAEQTGATFDDVERAIRFMQKQGLSADKFDEIAQAIAAIEDPTKRAAMAMKVWGKNGTALLPMLKELPELRGQARELGVSMSPEQARLADDLGDSFGRLKAALTGITMQIGAALAPVLIRIIDVFTIAAMAVVNFIRANPGLVTALAMAAAAFVVIGSGMVALGAVIAVLATPVGVVAALFATLAAVTAALVVTFRTVISGMLKAAAIGAKGVLAMPLIPKPIKDFLTGFISVMGAAANLIPKFPKMNIPDFTGNGLGELKGGGTSAGTASGRAAGLLGVGPGGGLLQETKKGNKLLEEVRDAVKGAKKAIEDLEGQKFE
jgi:hypothetical protein